MTEHFNNLTPGEAERLAMLAEEAAEVIQIVGKILRHGYESYHPKDLSMTNRMLLSREVTDFLAIVTMMESDFDPTATGDPVERIGDKLPYTHHQRD